MVTGVAEKHASSNFRIGECNRFPRNISKIVEDMDRKRSEAHHRRKRRRKRRKRRRKRRRRKRRRKKSGRSKKRRRGGGGRIGGGRRQGNVSTRVPEYNVS
jgi:hypothetical protein